MLSLYQEKKTNLFINCWVLIPDLLKDAFIGCQSIINEIIMLKLIPFQDTWERLERERFGESEAVAYTYTISTTRLLVHTTHTHTHYKV